MIQEFVDKFMAAKDDLFKDRRYTSYSDIVEEVVRVLHDPEDYGTPDPSRITQIDHGDYQGTLVFVIGADGYQPYEYWVTKVSYDSCSRCDTLQSINDYGSYAEPPTEVMTKGYQTLALHLVQRMVEV